MKNLTLRNNSADDQGGSLSIEKVNNYLNLYI